MTGIDTVYGAVAATARRHPTRPMLAVTTETARAYGIEPGEISYEAALARADEIAEALTAAGYGAGHRVGLLLENRPDFFHWWLALNRIGASIVPINPDLRPGEVGYLLAHSEVTAAVALPARQAALGAAAEAARRPIALFGPGDRPSRAPTPPPGASADALDRECALLYTSGTTGRPKGCVLTNLYFLMCGRHYASIGGYCAMEVGTERMITPLPTFHMNAIAYSFMAMVETAGCLVPLDGFHLSTWWDTVREARATAAHYLGVMPALLMTAPARTSDRDHDLKFAFGAGVPKDLHAPFEQRFGVPLIEAWGMTECGAGAVCISAHEPRHVGTAAFGRPHDRMEARIVREDGSDAAAGEPGELLVRHKGADPRRGFFREYLKDPAATAQAWAGGWFHTGDVVTRLDDGTFLFVDRRKNVIRRSGENIASAEVESVLLKHPAIANVGVMPVPDELRGEEVMALIVLRDEAAGRGEAGPALAREIALWAREQMAFYKAPGWIALVEALPLTPTQKVQRSSLKAQGLDAIASGRAIDLRALKARQREGAP